MSIKKKSETDILEYINKQKNHISEKNKYGEVFTNQSLIEELVHQIPDKIWKNPENHGNPANPENPGNPESPESPENHQNIKKKSNNPKNPDDPETQKS